MISDHFPRTFNWTCDDGGIYYIRQLDASDGVDFEGIVWFGQELVDRPNFANVFFGELRRGVGTDECGARLDRWEGQFFDVPKGRACGKDRLTIESYIVPIGRTAACDFPKPYLVRSGASAFGGSQWGMLSSACWDACLSSCCRRARAPIHPRIRSLRDAGTLDRVDGIQREVARLRSRALPAGFERTNPGNLTGTWLGNDGGTYYINHVEETGEVVWYAEFDDAHPYDASTDPDTPAMGWANVFRGRKSSTSITGIWADVPRGAANRAGQLGMTIESSSCIVIRDQTGGYGGTRLCRVEVMDVTVVVPQLNVIRAQEGLDEPWLWLFFYKFDGDSVDLDNLATSQVGGPDPQPPPILAGDNVTGLVNLPTHHTTYRTTLTTVRSTGRPETDVKAATRIGVTAFAIEVDEGYSNQFRHSNFQGWKGALLHRLNQLLQSGVMPSAEDILAAHRVHVMYLGPWEGWPWGDPDENVGPAVVEASFTDLEALANAAATLPGVPILRTLSFGNGSTRYTCRVQFFASHRINSLCR